MLLNTFSSKVGPVDRQARAIHFFSYVRPNIKAPVLRKKVRVRAPTAPVVGESQNAVDGRNENEMLISWNNAQSLGKKWNFGNFMNTKSF